MSLFDYFVGVGVGRRTAAAERPVDELPQGWSIEAEYRSLGLYILVSQKGSRSFEVLGSDRVDALAQARRIIRQGRAPRRPFARGTRR